MNRPEWKLLGELYHAHEDGIAFLKIKSKRFDGRLINSVSVKKVKKI